MAPRLPSVARYGDRPCSNVLRGLTVGIILVAALLTAEVQTFAVGCRDMPAGIAASACVAGTDLFHLNTHCCCFVADLKLHISIRPAMDFGTEVFPFAQRTVSNVLQVLNHDASCSDINRVADQCFRSDMQEMPCYGSLVSSQSSKKTSRGLGANRLNICASSADTRTAVIQFTSVEEKCFGVSRVGSDEHPFNTHVHPNKATFGFRLRDFYFVGEEQIPLFAYAFKLGVFPADGRKSTAVLDGKKLTPKSDTLLSPVKISFPYDWHYCSRKLSQSPAIFSLGCFIGCTNGFTE